MAGISVKKYVKGPVDDSKDIIFFNHTTEMSGGEIALLDLLRHGISDSFHVHVETAGPLVGELSVLPNTSFSIRNNAESIKATPKSRRRKLYRTVVLAYRMRCAYKNVLDRFGGKVVYANTLRSALIVSTLNLKDRSFVYHQRDQLSSRYLGRVTSKLVRAVLGGRVDLVIANSHSTAATAPYGAHALEVVPSAVADTFFELAPPRTLDPINILMLGRISPWKGQMEFLRAVARVNELPNTPPWHVNIVGGALFGETQYLDDITKFIADNNLNSRVQLIGHVSDPAKYMNECHILVHSSVLPEPFGQVVAQAMAAGRAIIAANSGGPAEILTDHISALLVEPTDTFVFSEAIYKLIVDSEFRSFIGSAAKIDAAPFRINQVGGAVQLLLDRLVKSDR